MCGDGIIQDGEDCDASATGEATCQTLGFDTGQVVCKACKYDTTLCVKRCGNGVLDLGESCDGTLNVPACTNWGFNACSDSCVVDTRRCLSTSPFETGPELTVDKGGNTVLGDMSPTGPGDVVMVVPAFNRIEIFPWNMTRGFEATGSRKLSFQRTPRQVEVFDANGDGITDLAVCNDDSTTDLIVGGATYSLTEIDAGTPCLSGRFLPTNGVARRTAVFSQPNETLWFSEGGISVRQTAGMRAAAWGPHGVVWATSLHFYFSDGGTAPMPEFADELGTADLDGDGDEDLVLALGAGNMQLFENTGAGFAPRQTFDHVNSGLAHLRVVDFDQDGRDDVFWVEPAAFVVRRNDGAFTFTETRVAITDERPSSVSLGDADGDGDLDVAITWPHGATDRTTTRVWRNRVR